MSRQIILQILRTPDAATRLTLTPEDGEFIYQKDTGALYIGDGSTAGGNFLALIGSSTPVINASNIGVGGLGLFKQLNVDTLEFKNINAGSSKVTVTNDSPNDEIDIDIDPSQILTSSLNNDAGFLNETNHDALPQDNPHNVTKTQVGLGNVDNTSDLNKPISTATQSALDLKYNSSNPNGYETPTQLGTRDTNNRNRSNHTGTQLASTISDFASTVRSTLLSGLSITNALVTASDTVLSAIGKLQGQINSFVFGKNYEYFSSEGNSTTTSRSYQTKLTGNTSSLVAGQRYRISWYMEHINLGSTSDISDVRMLVDGTEVGLDIYEQEDSSEIRSFSGFYEFTAPSSISIPLVLQYRQIDGGTCFVRRARIEIWRVS